MKKIESGVYMIGAASDDFDDLSDAANAVTNDLNRKNNPNFGKVSFMAKQFQLGNETTKYINEEKAKKDLLAKKKKDEAQTNFFDNALTVTKSAFDVSTLLGNSGTVDKFFNSLVTWMIDVRNSDNPLDEIIKAGSDKGQYLLDSLGLNPDKFKNDVKIDNITINTEDNADAIKTEFMNLVIELQKMTGDKNVSNIINGVTGNNGNNNPTS